jgi:hypothetical protein
MSTIKAPKSIIQIGPMIATSIKAFGEGSERSVQSQQGIMGPSDLGFCRNKAALMTRGVEQSDSKSIAAAQIGTAVHAYVADALKAMFPQWIIEDHKVKATFPSGAEVSGTPDIIAPDYNALIDVKTVDGFEWVKREGTSQNHKFQRATYALGAIQEGLLDGQQTVYVGNLYIDRSGKEEEPLLIVDEFDWSIIDEIDNWISDVQYAVMQKEDASRDIPAPICERICEFYTACRGNLPVAEGAETITDHDRKAALVMYLEGGDLEKQGAKMKRSAKEILVDTNGIAEVNGEYLQVRWTHINATEVAATVRAATDRIDVRKVKAPQ